MPTPPQFHVFFSAVSREFRTERIQLENWLERKGLHVSSQEKFNQGDSTLWKKLHDEVARCQAVICVIGAEPGWPSGGELPQGAPDRSWTQWEFWLAWGEPPWSPPRRDKVYVFFPSDLDERLKKAGDAAAGAVDRLHALDLQQAHIERIKDTNKHYETFTDSDDLIKRCLILDLPTLERTKPNNLTVATLGSLFKGRDEQLVDLHRRVTAHSSQAKGNGARQAIHGLGGVGKTRFVVEYAFRHHEDYQALLFVPAEQPEALNRNLAMLCGPLALNLPEQDAKEEATQLNAVLRWLKAHQGWLLMLDNVDASEGAEAIERLVGHFRGGTVLITTRLADWSAEIPTFELLELSEQAAVEFLLDRTNNKRRQLGADESDARSLAKELGYLAVALGQAGAFIVQKRSSLADYLARWRQRDRVVQRWNDERLTKYSHAVVTTWDTTVDQLSQEAIALLDQLSWLAPEPIPRDILPEGALQDALAELVGFSLATLDADGRRFRIHRLVQDVTRERQNEKEQTHSLKAALELVNNAIPDDPNNVRTWPLWEPLRSHVAMVTSHADRHAIADPTTILMNYLALLLLAKANYKEAEPLLRRALAIDEASYGAEHPNVARDLNNLAQLLLVTNRLVEAEPLMWRALAIDEGSYGPEHPRFATELNNLAQFLRMTNRLVEAEPLMRRALAIDKANYGAEHPKVAVRLNNLAQLLQDTNRLTEAEPLMRRVVSILIKFTHSTGHLHPHLRLAFRNYTSLLQASSLSAEETARSLQDLGGKAGLDVTTYRRFLAEFLS